MSPQGGDLGELPGPEAAENPLRGARPGAPCPEAQRLLLPSPGRSAFPAGHAPAAGLPVRQGFSISPFHAHFPVPSVRVIVLERTMIHHKITS